MNFTQLGYHYVSILSDNFNIEQDTRYVHMDAVNPFADEGTSMQCTKKQKIMKIILTLSYWYSLNSSCWVLSDEYPSARVSVIIHVFCIIL